VADARRRARKYGATKPATSERVSRTVKPDGTVRVFWPDGREESYASSSEFELARTGESGKRESRFSIARAYGLDTAERGE
jgi:hypothetical protein